LALAKWIKEKDATATDATDSNLIPKEMMDSFYPEFIVLRKEYFVTHLSEVLRNNKAMLFYQSSGS